VVVARVLLAALPFLYGKGRHILEAEQTTPIFGSGWRGTGQSLVDERLSLRGARDIHWPLSISKMLRLDQAPGSG
jgi:hypothetical protein